MSGISPEDLNTFYIIDSDMSSYKIEVFQPNSIRLFLWKNKMSAFTPLSTIKTVRKPADYIVGVTFPFSTTIPVLHFLL